MKMPAIFGQFFSLDSAKAIKARKKGYLNGINYMAPASTGGAGNLCPHASAGCLALCLGWYSGQAAMIDSDGNNTTRKSRIAKAQLFMNDRATFLREMVAGIKRAERKAAREGLKICVRLNGASDISWEGIRNVQGPNGQSFANIFEAFPHIQFVDYTKSVRRAMAYANHMLPLNYHITFSRSETNETDCIRVLEAGGNVSVVFADALPAEYLGSKVLDGDETDLRHLDFDARASSGFPAMRGYVIGLSPKGLKAKHDNSGFVVRI
jgi:hypothetical protein